MEANSNGHWKIIRQPTTFRHGMMFDSIYGTVWRVRRVAPILSAGLTNPQGALLEGLGTPCYRHHNFYTDYPARVANIGVIIALSSDSGRRDDSPMAMSGVAFMTSR